MRMGQGVRTGLGHGVITCVLQTQFSSSHYLRTICWKSLTREHRIHYAGLSKFLLIISHF